MFGVLVFVLGTLVVSGAWSVIDAKFAADSAAAAGTRTFVEAPGGTDPTAAARQAAEDAWRGFGRSGVPDVSVSTDALDRCAPVTVIVRAKVTLIPVFGRGGQMEVSASRTEVVDPYRSGLGKATGACTP